MSMPHRWGGVSVLAVLAAITAEPVWTAQAASEYLSYQEPQGTASSFLSTFAYVITLLLTFAAVIGLAYFTSRFLGQKMGSYSTGVNQKVLANLALGPNRGISVVEIAGKILIVGVTEHTINLLEEVTDEEEVRRLKEQYTVHPASNQPFDAVFRRHLSALSDMTNRFPSAFGRQRSEDNERGKR